MLISRHAKGWTILAPAKINWFLEVVGKRPDGFHELETVMGAISLTDRLTFSDRRDGKIQLEIIPSPDLRDSSIPQDERNLIVRALNAVRDRYQISSGMDVRLYKNIPMEAGLGGGSSNAAAAIVAGMGIWRNAFQRSSAHAIAAKLGSDINFFLFGGLGGLWVSRCSGKGDEVSSLEMRADFSLMIAKPRHGCATSEIFRRLDLSGEQKGIDRYLVAMKGNDLSQLRDQTFNRLESVATRLVPEIGQLRYLMEDADVLAQAMTGSGSARFAICRSAAHARIAAQRVRAKSQSWATAVTMWRAPSVDSQLRAIGIDV